jgi:hypothetical protein
MNYSSNSVREYENPSHSNHLERSELYNLEPLGLGTPYIESLTSYIARLAFEHSVKVSVLLRKMIAPNVKSSFLNDFLSSGKTIRHYPHIDGISDNSIEIIDVLERLTARNDIHNLTMNNWRGILSFNVVGPFRKWCPICFEQLKFDNKEIYEPLIWRIKDVKKCDIHEIKLHDKCPECQKTLPIKHNSLLKNGHCQYCFTWLGNCNNFIEREPLTENERFVTDNYKQLIQKQSELDNFPTREFISDLLIKIQDDIGFKSSSEFARFLEVNKERLHTWIRRKNTPNVEGLINIANKLNLTIYNVIYEYNVNSFSKIDSDNKNEIVSDKQFSIKKIEISLNDAIRSGIPKSLNQICKESGISVTSAKRNYPELSKWIMDIYTSYQTQIKIEEKFRLEKILKECLTYEEPISLEECLSRHGIPYTTAKRKLPSLCVEVSNRFKAYRDLLAKERFERLSFEMKDVILNLHTKGVYPSMIKIDNVLSYKGLFLIKKFRNLRKEILVSLGYKNV